MAVDVSIQNEFRIVVPVRFRRNGHGGGPSADSPDMDDRGFRQPTRPAKWISTDARGPQFGMMVGKSVRVQVVREDLDAGAPLFAVATKKSNPQFRVDLGVTGQIPPDGVIPLTALADSGAVQKLEVRLGSKDGPILAEAEPHIFSPLTVNVTPHVCRLHVAASAPGAGHTPQINGAPIDMARIRDGVNGVWQPAGVRFNFGTTREHDYFGYSRDNVALRQPAGVAVGTRGHVVSQHQVPNTINAYFVAHITEGVLGTGVNRDTLGLLSWTKPGIIVAVEGSVVGATGALFSRPSSGDALYQEIINDVSHELGHFLTLPHAAQVNSPGRADTFTRKCLMHPNNLLPQAGSGNIRFDDIGYGTGHRGCLITTKAHTNIPTDAEVPQARLRARDPSKLY
ncbi:MAG: hypothetical protein H6811_06450 [Phycisphaeraceae bacterium]|nr:hypothetical protein [Phycisphaeraceae bacterium]